MKVLPFYTLRAASMSSRLKKAGAVCWITRSGKDISLPSVTRPDAPDLSSPSIKPDLHGRSGEAVQARRYRNQREWTRYRSKTLQDQMKSKTASPYRCRLLEAEASPAMTCFARMRT